MAAPIEQILGQARVIPVVTVTRAEDAVPLARALVAGGLPVLEIALRTIAALDAVKAIRQEVEEAVPGVGTVKHPQELIDAKNAGAIFAVSPGFQEGLSSAARLIDLPYMPGVASTSEVMNAEAAGHRCLKFFPAVAAGGAAALRAFAGPFPDMVFCPTGGINSDNLGEFLALENVLCVGGSWLSPRALIDAGAWDEITALAKQTAG